MRKARILSVLSEVHNDYLVDVIVRGNIPNEIVAEELHRSQGVIRMFASGGGSWDVDYWINRTKILEEVLYS